MDPTLLLILAILGFWVCAGFGAAAVLGFLIRRHKRIRAKQVESLLAHMARHPAGRRLHPLGRPVIVLPCQCVLFCESGDRLDAELMALAHVEKCDIARSIRGEAA